MKDESRTNANDILVQLNHILSTLTDNVNIFQS